MRVEVTPTVDVSREGVLLYRSEACEPQTRVWLVFPYDRSAGASAQPETPARIVRVARDENGGYWVAVRLESRRRGSSRPGDQERRRSERIPFALPIFVRLAGTPWPEESMTRDVSQNGTRFETSHVYAAGDTVLAQIPWGEWSKTGEISGRVVRVENVEDSPVSTTTVDPENRATAIFASVAVEWLNGATNGDAKAAKS